MEHLLQWKTSLNGTSPSVKDQLKWNVSFRERPAEMEHLQRSSNNLRFSSSWGGMLCQQEDIGWAFTLTQGNDPIVWKMLTPSTSFSLLIFFLGGTLGGGVSSSCEVGTAPFSPKCKDKSPLGCKPPGLCLGGNSGGMSTLSRVPSPPPVSLSLSRLRSRSLSSLSSSFIISEGDGVLGVKVSMRSMRLSRSGPLSSIKASAMEAATSRSSGRLLAGGVAAHPGVLGGCR